jgi:hypothetical protein
VVIRFLNPPFGKGGGEEVTAGLSVFSKKIKSIESLYFTYHKRIYS